MTSTPHTEQDPGTRSERELVAEIGRWVLSVLRTEPGWDSMRVDFKPQGERVYLRVAENRDGTAIPGAAGPIKQDSPVLNALDELQRSCYLKGRGSWFSVSVTIAAKDWPEPDYRFAARYNYQDLPPQFSNEGQYGAQDIATHLSAFPRTAARTPEWAIGITGEQGIDLEFVDPMDDQSAQADDAHPRLREAIAQYVANPVDQAMANVLREAMTGVVLLDITGSDLVPGEDGQPVGPESNIRVQALGQKDGTRALAVYTTTEEARTVFRENNKDSEKTEPVLFRQQSAAVLNMVATDPQYDELVYDPGGENPMRIKREQIEWVNRTPHNRAVKDALLDNNMSGLLAAVLNPNGQLLFGTRDQDGKSMPVMVQPQDPNAAPDTIMVFTSAAEIAALDTSLQVRAAPSREVLKFVVDSGAAGMCVNALPPVATIPTEQLRELLELVAQQENQQQDEQR
ncbi:SseB family protein [Kocuria atrinae]|uniref:SseB protein N-terminal domain-containing protein n=1 Tax=Kocuria atrinae TaxID=592377 RepID=A0ABP5J4B4_9MICC